MSVATILGADPDKVATWAKLLRDIGVPVVMLGVMSYAMYKGGIWIGEQILVPTLKKNEELVEGQVESNKALLKSLNQVTEHIRIQTENNKSNTDSLTKISNDISIIRELTETNTKESIRYFAESAKLLEDVADSVHKAPE